MLKLYAESIMKMTEDQYRDLVVEMIDFIVGRSIESDDLLLLRLIPAAFASVDVWPNGDFWDNGYWERVYVSLASTIDEKYGADLRFKNRPDNRPAESN